ncbi:trypsin-1-like isoform X2 [Macrobrachium rosenbergii]|uniref:trypsin-1-like isoform X2 n=1 Tax=Macrobrachium rosenbergii TaxID=79674 RepID=UPI0034D61007
MRLRLSTSSVLCLITLWGINIATASEVPLQGAPSERQLENNQTGNNNENIAIGAKDGNLLSVNCGTYQLSPGDELGIESPDYPNPYPLVHLCAWDFQGTTPQTRLSLSCSDFDLGNCIGSSVTISNGSFIQGYCDKQESVSFESNSNRLTVFFRTLTFQAKKGFQCRIWASDPTSGADAAVPPPARANDACVCGKVNRDLKIVGGKVTEKHEYPWQVGLTSHSLSQPFCGGSIISHLYVLTAAHCVDGFSPEVVTAVLGPHDWSTASESGSTQKRIVSKIIIHPNFNSTTQDNDIALLRLSTPVNFPADNQIAPICLPPAGKLYEDVNATATGWDGNITSILHEVTVPTMTNAKCAQMNEMVITENMLCAGRDEGKQVACQGDSGGPLVTNDDGTTRMIQIGIVSWGQGCAVPGKPGVYTRVNRYLKWIRGHTSGTPFCPPTPDR